MSDSRPSPALVDLIRDRDWQSVKSHIQSHPWDARYKTSNQSTTLHHACLYRAPYEVCFDILETYPEAVYAQDSQGWTPLHVSLLYNAAEDVCLLLIARGGAPSTSAEYVSSPLHLACRHGASARVMRALLQACPNMANTVSESGTKPANLLWFGFRKRTSDHAIDDLENGHVEELMSRLGMLLHAARGRSIEEDSVVSLHEVIELHSELHHLIALLIRLFPDECRRLDINGNLPLHHLTAHCSGVVTILEKLLQAYPTAARIPDNKGRLPLHVALSQGRWTWSTGVDKLVRASPESLATRNILTRLYPAQEAVYDVDTVLQLLLAWPVLLANQ